MPSVSTSLGLESKLAAWYSWTKDLNPEAYRSVKDLEEAGKKEELATWFGDRLVFGTAGIRGKMGPGISQMNDVVIVQTSQGLAQYVLKCNGFNATDQAVIVGHDARHNSKRWAGLTAAAFKRLGFKVYLFSDITPTPWVPYALLRHKAVCGVMVTASHNPKEDNGYKTYWNTGAQIIPPHDVNIADSILENLTPHPESFSPMTSDNFIDPLKESSDAYYRDLVGDSYDLKLNSRSENPRIVYTAMHGVGAEFIDRAFKECGFKAVVQVPEQKEPNPDFPTVKFPNPEEGKSALNLSMAKAEEEGIKYILANDPDADRLAIAEKTTDGWKVFTGNEIGSLLGWWMMKDYLKKAESSPAALPKDKLWFIASTVSSKMLRSVAAKDGLQFEETLTGFKWMCSRAKEVEDNEGGKVLLAFEEAIGFMCGSRVLDKDGVSAAIRAAELMAFLDKECGGIGLNEKLIELYHEYGYHSGTTNYFKVTDSQISDKIFYRLRHYGGTDKKEYPDVLNTSLGKYKIASVRDLTTGYDSQYKDLKARLPSTPDAHMITFTLENGTVLTIRNSGTEPKLKYYGEFCGKPEQKDWSSIRDELAVIIQGVIHDFIQPEQNGIKV